MWTKNYSEAKAICGEPREVRKLDGIYTHEMQPYGWVKMSSCVLWECEVPQFDFNQQAYTGTRKELVVAGVVDDSSYCGALYCGVPVRKPDSSTYRPGSSHSCVVRHDNDLTDMRTVTTPNL